jgi:hypothetical protein
MLTFTATASDGHIMHAVTWRLCPPATPVCAIAGRGWDRERGLRARQAAEHAMPPRELGPSLLSSAPVLGLVVLPFANHASMLQRS